MYLKQYLKHYPLVVRPKRHVWPPFDATSGATTLNLLTTFPQFSPFSAGCYETRADLTIEAINHVFPLLRSLASSFGSDALAVTKIENFPQTADEVTASTAAKFIFDKYHTAKASRHNYHFVYGPILKNRCAINGVLEIGIGTNNTDVVSNIGHNVRPGASLKAFQDLLPIARIYGADIDKRILFDEGRIQTFFVDQTQPRSFRLLDQVIPSDLDLVIDDGLHSPSANVATLQFALSKVKIGGWVVIENIPDDANPIWIVVAALLPKTFQPYLLAAKGGNVFAVKRLDR